MDILILLILLYILPIIIALIRGHKNMVAISTLNILTGWTAIGWIASLIWSLTK
jgi:hypothetical protein